MKKLDILFNTSLKQVQGINYVNNSFVEGQRYFKDNDISLNKIFSPDGVFDCSQHEKLVTIGSDVNLPEYRRTRKIRTLLRNVLSSKYLFGCIIKLLFNTIFPARKALNYYFNNQPNSDLIIFQDTFTAYFYYKSKKRLGNTKTILILHCCEDPIEQGIPMFPGFFKYKKLERIFRYTVEFAMDSCDKVVYLSQNAINHSNLPAVHKSFVFNGIEDVKYHEFENVHNPLNFIIVASVILHKGQHILLEALSLLSPEVKKNIKLNIVGLGTHLEECKRVARVNNLLDIVKFWGNSNDVAVILKEMDVFILPSLSEGMPMSIIEAMRQGLYIMATPVGGIPEMIQPNFGEFIERDAQVIADAITCLVEHHKVTTESKEAAREYYLQNFTLKKMIDSYSKILLSL